MQCMSIATSIILGKTSWTLFKMLMCVLTILINICWKLYSDTLLRNNLKYSELGIRF